jgi:hypothetical protein
MKALPTLGLLCTLHVDAERALEELCSLRRCRAPELASEIAARCDVVVLRSPFRLTAGQIDSAPKLRWIARAGSGTDLVDLGAAHRRGISVEIFPANAVSVAEHAIGLLRSVARISSGFDPSSVPHAAVLFTRLTRNHLSFSARFGWPPGRGVSCDLSIRASGETPGRR